MSPIPRVASNRYLSDVQNGSFSLDAKRRQIKGQAERDDVEIVRIFADPAQSAHRKQYNPAIKRHAKIKHVLSVKSRPDYEPLFSILDGLSLDGERRLRIECKKQKGTSLT